MTPLTNNWHQSRRHELDWLRVLAFGLLILYHLGMAYVAEWGWHIKSLYQNEWLQPVMLWSNQWRMSLLFLISGAAVSYQLHKNHSWRFFSHSARRLFIPLLFGSLVIVAPQSFVELKVKGYIVDMSYLAFWRDYLGHPFFGDPLPPAYGRLEPSQITWNHLWYLAYLLAYIGVLWAIYPLLVKPRVKNIAEVLNRKLHPSMLYILPITLIFIIGQLLWQRFPTTHLLVDDWHNNARYFLIFFIGFTLVRSNRLWSAVKQCRQFSLVLAMLSYAAILFYSKGGELSQYLAMIKPIEAPLRGLVWSANSWLWILAILGYAQAWLNRPNRHIQAANRGVYCYYILHQTLIVLALYGLSRYALGPIVEPMLLIVITVGGCALGYALVKPIPGLRRLLGVNNPPTRSN